MWQKIASPPCNIPTHNWTQRVFISPKACSCWSKGAFLGRQNPWLLGPERTSWGSHYEWHCWNPLDERSAFRAGGGEGGGLMSTGGTHLSSKDHFWVFPVLYSPTKCKSTPKTCLMDSQNFIPKGSLLGLGSVGIQRLGAPPWLCMNSVFDRIELNRVRLYRLHLQGQAPRCR